MKLFHSAQFPSTSAGVGKDSFEFLKMLILHSTQHSHLRFGEIPEEISHSPPKPSGSSRSEIALNI